MKARWFLLPAALWLAVLLVVPADAAPGDPPKLDGIVRIYTGGWTADVNGDGTCEGDPQTTYVAQELPQGKFRFEANGRRINQSGRYDLTVIVWAVDHTGTEMTRWNQETHLPGPTGNAEIVQGDQHYAVAWENSMRPAPDKPVTWFFQFVLHRILSGGGFATVADFTCSVQVVAP